MAKNQSQRPGRDVRGGKGKAQTQATGPGGKGADAGARRGGGAPQRAGQGKRGNQGVPRGEMRPESRKAPRREGAPAGSGSWIEGRRAVVEALEVGMPLRRALVAAGDASLAGLARELEAAGVPVERVARGKLDAISSHGAHQGIAVQAAPFKYAQLEDVIARAGDGDALVLVLDHVTDQGNLGAIVRSAEVVGAAGVIIPKARAAGVGVGAYKTSAGAVLHLPIVQVSNLATTIEALKGHGFWVGGSTEHARDGVWEAPMGGRLCLVMGSEGSGISRLVLDHCDFTCKLPQRGRVESLNVAQAATVMCYEWLRRVSYGGLETAPELLTGEPPVRTPAAEPVPAAGLDFMSDAAAGRRIDWDL